MIRDATAEDLTAILRIGREFWRDTGVAELVPWDEDTACDILVNLLSGEAEGALLVSTDDAGTIRGAAAAVYFPHLLNRNHRTGIELFWRADRGFGMPLRRELEARARKAGLDSFAMASMPGEHEQRVGTVYERAGYRAVERVFLKGF